MLLRNFVLLFLPIFVSCAIYLNWAQDPFQFDAPYWAIKILVWAAFWGFFFYSGYCTLKEDLFDTVKKIVGWHFGRQICLDLYLGLGVMLFVMFLNEPTLLGFLAWAIPTLFYVNILTLLYVAIHFDQIVAKLLTVIG